ncbi:MAG: hypothetical protein ACI9KE_006319 [Polyangiales bacterium]|jgi:hypothetical protein
MLKQSVWFLGLIFAASCGGDPSFVLDRHNDPTTESEGVRRVRARQNLVYVLPSTVFEGQARRLHDGHRIAA